MYRLNAMLTAGLIFAALILLRPLLVLLLRPRHRVILWFACFFFAYLGAVFDFLCRVPLLPVSFLTLLSPWLPPGYEPGGRTVLALPQFLENRLYMTPDGRFEDQWTLALPGLDAPLPLEERTVMLFGVLWILGAVFYALWCFAREHKVKALARGGELLSTGCLPDILLEESALVRRCGGLPASFVCYNPSPGARYLVCLQDGLSPEHMDLVLLHEGEHIRMHHIWFKHVASLALMAGWWNPLFWAAYRLTCRDLELSCDEAVMDQLDGKGRRDYARALVELGSGKHLWGTAGFGECDAALRVKRAAAWKPRGALQNGLSLALTVLLIAFFFFGSWV